MLGKKICGMVMLSMMLASGKVINTPDTKVTTTLNPKLGLVSQTSSEANVDKN